MWDSQEEMLAELIEAGCINDAYYNPEVDDVSVEWNMDALKEKYPEVHAAIMDEHLERVSRDLDVLVDEGLVEVSFDGDSDKMEPVFRLSEKGAEYLEGLPGIDEQ